MLRRRSDGPSVDPYLDRPQPIELSSRADFQLGALTVRPSILQIEVDSSSRTIEPRVMQALVALSDGRGSVVSRDQLIDLCWSGRIVGEDAINRCLAKVRAIGAETQAFQVETIPRVGYRLLASEVEKTAPESAGRLGAASWLTGVAAVLVVALVAAALWYRNDSGQAARPTIAVLPFTPLNSDAETRNFGESIAATVSSALIQTGARLPADVRTADEARKSGAALIISGTIRRDGPTFRVTARFDSTRAGSTIASNEFQAEAANAAWLPAEVSAWLLPPVRMWSSFLPTERDPSTTDEILRIFLTRSAGEGLRAWGLSRSLARAKRDSGAAQLVLALLTSDVLAGIDPEQRGAAVDAARQAALRAAQELPDPARAKAVLDCHLTAPGWLVLTPQCDRQTRAAISADPDVPLLPFLFGWQLAEAGRFAEAAKFADMDLAQAPLGGSQLDLRIFVTKMSNKPDSDGVLPQLEDRMRRYIGGDALTYSDYRVAVASGNIPAAQAIMNSDPAAVADDESAATIRVALRAATSKFPADIKAMQQACNSPVQVPEDPAFGTCLAGLTLVGDLNDAFVLAQRGYRDVQCCSKAEQEQQWLATGGTYYPRWELLGKGMASLRADPRFTEIARRTGLLAYWKSGHPPDFCTVERVPVCASLH